MCCTDFDFLACSPVLTSFCEELATLSFKMDNNYYRDYSENLSTQKRSSQWLRTMNRNDDNPTKSKRTSQTHYDLVQVQKQIAEEEKREELAARGSSASASAPSTGLAALAATGGAALISRYLTPPQQIQNVELERRRIATLKKLSDLKAAEASQLNQELEKTSALPESTFLTMTRQLAQQRLENVTRESKSFYNQYLQANTALNATLRQSRAQQIAAAPILETVTRSDVSGIQDFPPFHGVNLIGNVIPKTVRELSVEETIALAEESRASKRQRTGPSSSSVTALRPFSSSSVQRPIGSSSATSSATSRSQPPAPPPVIRTSAQAQASAAAPLTRKEQLLQEKERLAEERRLEILQNPVYQASLKRLEEVQAEREANLSESEKLKLQLIEEKKKKAQQPGLTSVERLRREASTNLSAHIRDTISKSRLVGTENLTEFVRKAPLVGEENLSTLIDALNARKAAKNLDQIRVLDIDFGNVPFSLSALIEFQTLIFRMKQLEVFIARNIKGLFPCETICKFIHDIPIAKRPKVKKMAFLNVTVDDETDFNEDEEEQEKAESSESSRYVKSIFDLLVPLELETIQFTLLTQVEEDPIGNRFEAFNDPRAQRSIKSLTLYQAGSPLNAAEAASLNNLRVQKFETEPEFLETVCRTSPNAFDNLKISMRSFTAIVRNGQYVNLTPARLEPVINWIKRLTIREYGVRCERRADIETSPALFDRLTSTDLLSAPNISLSMKNYTIADYGLPTIESVNKALASLEASPVARKLHELRFEGEYVPMVQLAEAIRANRFPALQALVLDVRDFRSARFGEYDQEALLSFTDVLGGLALAPLPAGRTNVTLRLPYNNKDSVINIVESIWPDPASDTAAQRARKSNFGQIRTALQSETIKIEDLPVENRQ